MEGQQGVDESEAVLSVERLNLPVGVSHWVLEEASNIFERSPFLGIVSWLHSSIHPLCEVAVGGLHQGSARSVSRIGALTLRSCRHVH